MLSWRLLSVELMYGVSVLMMGKRNSCISCSPYIARLVLYQLLTNFKPQSPVGCGCPRNQAVAMIRVCT